MSSINKLQEYYTLLYKEWTNPTPFIEFTEEEEIKQQIKKEQRRLKWNEYMKARQRRIVREKYGLPPDAKLPKRRLTEEHKAKTRRKPKKGTSKYDQTYNI